MNTDQKNFQLKLGIRSNPYPPEVGNHFKLTAKTTIKMTAMPNAGKLLIKILTGIRTRSKPPFRYAANAPSVFPMIQPTMIAGNCNATVHQIDDLTTSATVLGYWLNEKPKSPCITFFTYRKNCSSMGLLVPNRSAYC